MQLEIVKQSSSYIFLVMMLPNELRKGTNKTEIIAQIGNYDYFVCGQQKATTVTPVNEISINNWSTYLICSFNIKYESTIVTIGVKLLAIATNDTGRYLNTEKLITTTRIA